MNLETGLTADEIRAMLGPERHPTSCGFVAETYRTSLNIPTGALPDAYESDHPYASALVPTTARYAPLASTE